MSDRDLGYGLELLGEAVARGATGIAAPGDGDPDRRRRIVRALRALEGRGLAEVVRTAAGVVGAEMSYAGFLTGQAIAARSPPPERRPGDVTDVVVVRERTAREPE